MKNSRKRRAASTPTSKRQACAGDHNWPLFRSAIGKTGQLSDKPMMRVDVWRMVRRRASDAGIETAIGFGAEFDVLLYDLTSTYVEGAAENNPMMRRGYSRDHRPDCEQMVIALIAARARLCHNWKPWSTGSLLSREP